MSSSDEPKAARRFLRHSAASFGIVVAAALAACWLLDPTGLLSLGGAGANLCTPGSRGGDERFTAMLIPRLLQPNEIVVGSSRSIWMFRDGALPGRAANLAISSASIAEIDTITRRAIADAPVRRVWIGVDFGAFEQARERSGMLEQPWAVRNRRLTAVRYGIFHPRALRATLVALADPQGCADPWFSAAGFARRPPPEPTATERAGRPDATTEARRLRTWQVPRAQREHWFSDQFTRLEALLEELKHRRIAVVLFLTPSTSAGMAYVSRAGLIGDYDRWRGRLLTYADATSHVVVIPSDSPEFLQSTARAGCEGQDREACLFYDIAHARPMVGDAIVRAGVAQAPQVRPDGLDDS